MALHQSATVSCCNSLLSLTQEFATIVQAIVTLNTQSHYKRKEL